MCQQDEIKRQTHTHARTLTHRHAHTHTDGGLPTQTMQRSSDGTQRYGREAAAGQREEDSCYEALGRRSVVLEQGQQVIAAVVGQVGRAQVGQQLVRVGQLRKKLDGVKGER